MKDKTKQAIIDAIDQLASAKPLQTNGKVSGVNLAKEAGVSKATLYRYLNENTDLQADYAALRKNGVREKNVVPETLEQAFRLVSDEVKALRSTLSAD
jgi:AcrR family transcriptional regulator